MCFPEAERRATRLDIYAGIRWGDQLRIDQSMARNGDESTAHPSTARTASSTLLLRKELFASKAPDSGSVAGASR